jgi:hypothetical protein
MIFQYGGKLSFFMGISRGKPDSHLIMIAEKRGEGYICFSVLGTKELDSTMETLMM